jgi:hypothetical protein
VPQRVVDQVPERLAHAQRVGGDREVAPRDADVAAVLAGAVDEAVAHALEQRGHGERLGPYRQAALAGAGEHQQVLGQLREVVALLHSRHERGPHLGGVLARPQHALELGLEHGDRRAQLVARVRHEASLALEGAAQPVEHVVERLAEAADLVTGGGERQPVAAGRERHPGRAGAHRLDGPQRGAGQRVAEQRGDEHGDRAPDGERGDQAAEDVVAVVRVQHLLPQLVPDLGVHERPGGREHEQRRGGERQREPQADGQPAHLRRRYPTPRTVSMEATPNGRSIFSRRYRTYTSTTFERCS